MKRKIICIIIIGMFLFTGSIGLTATSTTTEMDNLKTNTQDCKTIKTTIYRTDNKEIIYLDSDSQHLYLDKSLAVEKNIENEKINTLADEGISFSDLRVWWSLYKKELTIVYSRNYGSGYGCSEKTRVLLYADDETEPFYTSLWKPCNYIITMTLAKLDEKPVEITATIEIEENDPVEIFSQTTVVYDGVDVSGTVYESVNNRFVPLEKAWVTCFGFKLWAYYTYYTDATGEYHVCIWPHDLNQPSSYKVKTRADEDFLGKHITKYTEDALPGDHITDFNFYFTQKPNTPSAPSGPKTAVAGREYTYSASTTDPDGDKLYYAFVFGDLDTYAREQSDWLGPFDSGEEATITHNWDSSTKSGYVRVVAKDEYDRESEFSSILDVRVINLRSKSLIGQIFSCKYSFFILLINQIKESII